MRKARARRGRQAKALLAIACAAAVAASAVASGLSTVLPADLRDLIPAGDPTPAISATSDLPDWDPAAAPNYYEVAGPAVRDLDLAPGEVFYQGLDDLGRTGRVAACVTWQMMEDGIARDREDMAGIEPSGWGHNQKVAIVMPDGHVYHGYLFNRSHLLAKSLGGADTLENVVTGTRTQNVGGGGGGMAYCESLARDWLEEHPDGTVWYSATPVYREGEAVPRWVVVDVLTSDGAVDERVVVHNAAQGYDIDYATGSFSRL